MLESISRPSSEEPLMTAADRREHERAKIVSPPLGGVFTLHAEEQRHVFSRVNDLSISGTGIEVPMALPAGKEIGLSFADADCEINVLGDVAWCNRSEDGTTYRLGIKFSPKTAENNLLFFMALRRYIDPFGNA